VSTCDAVIKDTEIGSSGRLGCSVSNTGELKYGRITNMTGGDVIIRAITKEEAGPNPKRLSKRGIACAFDHNADGTPICSYHSMQLNQLTVHGDFNPRGLGHLSAWICPVSGKQIYDARF
jgi:hypothetical protein